MLLVCKNNKFILINSFAKTYINNTTTTCSANCTTRRLHRKPPLSDSSSASIESAVVAALLALRWLPLVVVAIESLWMSAS